MKDRAFYQYTKYLDEWKKGMDDEFLNKEVLKRLLDTKRRFKRILDVGTGSGVQIRRNIESGIVANNAHIIGIDINKELILSSYDSYKRWAKKNGFDIVSLKTNGIYEFILKKDKIRYHITVYPASVYDLGNEKTKNLGREFDLVTALSLLEHTDTKRSLQAIHKVMKRGAILYALINYDLHTIFGPTKPKMYRKEQDLMQLFNYVCVDNQFKGNVETGTSSCGAMLPILCKKQGFKILAYGPCDWVIPPGKAVQYPSHVKNLLRFFVDSFYKDFKNATSEDKKRFNVDDKLIREWHDLRVSQLKSGELYYTCVQKDILCKK